MAQTASAESVRCTKCELVHDRTADWHCPRCGSEVDLAHGPRLRSRGPFPTGSRIAGGISIVAGSIGLWIAEAGPHAPIALTISALLSLAIGGALLAQVSRVRAAALVLSVLGMLWAGAAAMWSSQNGYLHVVTGLQYVGLFVLLRGDPGKLAIGTGITLCVPPLLVAAFAALQLWLR